MGLYVVLFVVALVATLSTGPIAVYKNRNAMLWGLAGLVFSVLALILILILRPLRTCPQCDHKMVYTKFECPWCFYSFRDAANVKLGATDETEANSVPDSDGGASSETTNLTD